VEVPKEQYEELGKALSGMGTPCQDAEEFISCQISEALKNISDGNWPKQSEIVE
jgi:hypothetical protein